MEPRLLRSFVAVAEELHFGRAARRLHLSQPPLSVQIRKLEEDLGVRLFERTNRHVALTDAGEALLGRARHVLAELERARELAVRAGRGEAGTLAVGYTPTATYEVLPAVVPRFRAACPDVRLELRELRSAQVPEALRSGRIEVGLVCAPVDAAGLVSRTIARERLVVAVPARHALARLRRIPVARLRGEPFVVVDRTVEPGWADAVAGALEGKGVVPDIVQETDTKIAMLGLVAAGLGVTVVSASMTQLRRSGVEMRPLDGVGLTLPLDAVTTTDPSPRAARLAELLLTARSSASSSRPA
jgi:DNA-binding transcriptional LysR family regulator